ncbi:hypothetical protein CPC08DRAFT_810039, partial [Agrocybe pediades]
MKVVPTRCSGSGSRSMASSNQFVSGTSSCMVYSARWATSRLKQIGLSTFTPMAQFAFLSPSTLMISPLLRNLPQLLMLLSRSSPHTSNVVIWVLQSSFLVLASPETAPSALSCSTSTNSSWICLTAMVCLT